MTFHKYFKLAYYGMLLSGYFALWLPGQLDALTLGLYMAALVGSWIFNPESAAFKLPKVWINGLIFLYILFFLFDYFSLSHDFRIAAIRLLFFIAIFKLLTIQSDRDYMYLFIVAFLQLLLATTMTVQFSFVLALAGFLTSAIAALILFEIRKTARRTQRPAAPGRPSPTADHFAPMTAIRYPAARLLLGVTLILVVSILAVAIPIFFVVPRLSAGLWIHTIEPPQLITGFSNRVRLGEIGNIKQNPAVVMRVKVKGAEALPAAWKWRGVALDQYDGTTWTQSPMRRTTVSARRKGWPLNQQVFTLRVPEDRPQEPIIEQTILLESLNTNVLFTAGNVLSITSSDITHLMRDTMGALVLPNPPLSRLRYTVTATRTPGSEWEWPRTADYASTKYLALPTGMDTRIASLAAEITRGQVGPYEKAQAIENHLFSHYTYSLHLKGSGSGEDPLAQFLFSTRAGHCEYFASAMAILLRCLHIPSRLVNGFRLGEYNSIGRDYMVRQSDAHSWVEAFFPGYGWVEFDPTPPDPVASIYPVSQWVRHLADALELFWADHVVNYDVWQQTRAVNGAMRSFGVLENSISGFNRYWLQNLQSRLAHAELPRPRPDQARPLLMGLLAAAGLLALVEGLRRRPWLFTSNVQRRQSIAVEFYSEMLKALRRHGIEKPKHQTALEFCRAYDKRREAIYLTAITESYHKARYSRTPITADELWYMNRQLKQLKEALKRR